MSPQPIDRSADLRRLRDEGYEIEVRDGLLVVHHVPYVTPAREVAFGILVCALDLAGEQTTRPGTHTVDFVGAYPSNKDGTPIEALRNNSIQKTLAPGLVIDHTFSHKPPGGYADFYEKMARYVEVISAPARSLDPTATAKTFAVVPESPDGSPFVYTDTASSRAKITAVTAKLNGLRIGIVGVGGTGGYVVDLVAKTPVAEIHLFDGDRYANHNAFRAPGAAGIEDLRATPFKTEYFQRIYSRMHRGIRSHPHHIDAATVDGLRTMNFVFVCIDKAAPKKIIFDFLAECGISFVDVGMGVEVVDDRLVGIVRTTAGTAEKRDHVWTRVPLADPDVDDDYLSNVQIADLNMLNAAFAVIKWKKMCGIYDDRQHEHHSTYTINVNMLLSEDDGT